MSVPVAFGRVAEQDVERIDNWWKSNRPFALRLFREELDEAVDQLSVMPKSGAPYFPRKYKGMRRLLLRGSRHHVYYEFDGARVNIVSVWSAHRGRGPKLG